MRNLVKSLRLTLVFCVFFSICYILVLWIFGLIVGPGGGNAETLVLNGRVVGAANVGQQFTKDVYFWGRPSHAGDGYDASSSSGSNKGPTNEEYLADVNTRIDSFLEKHPYLDPHITPESAYVQVKRVAKARGMEEGAVRSLVDQAVEKPLLGMFGTEKVNVLKLNIALEKADSSVRH